MQRIVDKIIDTQILKPVECTQFKSIIYSSLAEINKNNESTLDNSLPPLFNLPENWLVATCRTNLSRIHETLFKLSRPQAKISDVAIFSAIIELDQELVTSNMQNKFEQDKYMPTSKC